MESLKACEFIHSLMIVQLFVRCMINKSKFEFFSALKNLNLFIHSTIYLINSGFLFVCRSRTIFGKKKVPTCILKVGNMVARLQS